jgi:hypothetical protein
VNWIAVEGVKPWDGRYPFDLEGDELTTREWGYIKRLTGYMPLTLEEGFDGGDPELFACFAVLMLKRAGRITAEQVEDVYERLIDAPFGSTIRLEADDDADKEEPGPPPGSSASSSGSSGDGSPTSSAISEYVRNGSGTPGSDGLVSAPQMSETSPRGS